MSLLTESMSTEHQPMSAPKPKREKGTKKPHDDMSPSTRGTIKTRSSKKVYSKEDAENLVPNKRKHSTKEHSQRADSPKASDVPEVRGDDSSSLVVEVGDSPLHSVGLSATTTHPFCGSPHDPAGGDTPRENVQANSLPSGIAAGSPFAASQTKSGGSSRVVSRWMAKHRDSVSAAGIFTVMASATEDEVEACYPSVSIVSGALRAGSLITPNAEGLRGELHSMEQEAEEPSDLKATPQQLRDALLAGAFIGSGEVIDDCLRKGAELTAAESSGRNILHYIATGGHGALCKKVLKRLQKDSDETLCQVLNKKDANGWTPLLVAVCRGQLEVVEALLADHRVDFNVTLTHSCPPSQGSDKPESSSIHFAAIQGSAQIVKRLLDRGMHMDVADNINRNIFHYIAAHKNQTLAGAFFASITSDPRFSPSHLLSQDIHLRDPLYTAVCYGATDLAVSMIRILSTATNKGQLDPDIPWSMTRALLSHDDMSLSCVQVAHLRRNYEVIYKLGEIWPLYCIVEGGDPDSFVEALLRETSQEDRPRDKRPQSPSLVITETLHDPHLWNTWLRADLTHAEKVVVDLVKRTLKFMAHQRGHQSPLDARHESQLMRSVRRCGSDVVLKSLDATLSHELDNASAKRTSEMGTFLTALRSTMSIAMNQREAQSAWKYINAEGTLITKSLKNATSSPGLNSPTCRFAAPTVTALRRLPTRAGEPTASSSGSRRGPIGSKPSIAISKLRGESASPDSAFRRQGSSPSGLPSFAAPTLSRLAAISKQPKIPVPPPPKRRLLVGSAPTREQALLKAATSHDGLDSSEETSGFCA